MKQSDELPIPKHVQVVQEIVELWDNGATFEQCVGVLERELSIRPDPASVGDEGLLRECREFCDVVAKYHRGLNVEGAVTLRNKLDAALSRPLAEGMVEAIPVSEIEAEIAHIEENGEQVRKVCGDENEGRCRVLCAMYLREFILGLRLNQKLTMLAAHQPTEGKK